MSDRTDKKENKGRIINFEKEWEEVRLCAKLIRDGKAEIVIGKKRNGSTCRYTKVKGGQV